MAMNDPYSGVASLLAGKSPAESPYQRPDVYDPRSSSAATLAGTAQPAATTQATQPVVNAAASTPPPATTNGGMGQVIDAYKNTHKDKYGQMWDSIYSGIDDPQDQADLKDYISYVQSLPTYKGSRDVQMSMIANYARQLRMNRRNAAAQTYGGLAKLGDENRSLQDTLAARLAASGHAGGGGVAAGAFSNLAGQTSANVADYIGQRDDEARREKLALTLAQMQRDAEAQRYNYERAMQDQQGGGLFGDILGSLGNLVPIVGGLLSKGGGPKPQPSPYY